MNNEGGTYSNSVHNDGDDDDDDNGQHEDHGRKAANLLHRALCSRVVLLLLAGDGVLAFGGAAKLWAVTFFLGKVKHVPIIRQLDIDGRQRQCKGSMCTQEETGRSASKETTQMSDKMRTCVCVCVRTLVVVGVAGRSTIAPRMHDKPLRFCASKNR